MRTGSALLHRWSAALDEYGFTVHHHPGKVQTHVDGLSRLPVGPLPPKDALLHIQVGGGGPPVSTGAAFRHPFRRPSLVEAI